MSIVRRRYRQKLTKYTIRVKITLMRNRLITGLALSLALSTGCDKSKPQLAVEQKATETSADVRTDVAKTVTGKDANNVEKPKDLLPMPVELALEALAKELPDNKKPSITGTVSQQLKASTKQGLTYAQLFDALGKAGLDVKNTETRNKVHVAFTRYFPKWSDLVQHDVSFDLYGERTNGQPSYFERTKFLEAQSGEGTRLEPRKIDYTNPEANIAFLEDKPGEHYHVEMTPKLPVVRLALQPVMKNFPHNQVISKKVVSADGSAKICLTTQNGVEEKNEGYTHISVAPGCDLIVFTSKPDFKAVETLLVRPMQYHADRKSGYDNTLSKHQTSIERLHEKDEQGNYVVSDQELKRIKTLVKSALNFPADVEVKLFIQRNSILRGEIHFNTDQRVTFDYDSANGVLIIGDRANVKPQEVSLAIQASARKR